MRSFGTKLGSLRMTLFEVLAENPRGLTPAEMSRLAKIPSSTVHRIIGDWSAHGILATAGKYRKSTVYRLNAADEMIKLMIASMSQFILHASELDARRLGHVNAAVKARLVPERVAPAGWGAQSSWKERDREPVIYRRGPFELVPDQ